MACTYMRFGALEGLGDRKRLNAWKVNGREVNGVSEWCCICDPYARPWSVNECFVAECCIVECCKGEYRRGHNTSDAGRDKEVNENFILRVIPIF